MTRDLLKSRQVMLDRHLQERAQWPARTAFREAPAPAPSIPEIDEEANRPARRRARFGLRSGPGLVLAGALATILGVHLFAPPDRYPRASVEPAFRTLRSANVRQAPSVKSPVLGRVGKDVLLRGEVQRVATTGPSDWLRITSGTHFDRYVALQNLEKR